jgi:hypothetical protein
MTVLYLCPRGGGWLAAFTDKKQSDILRNKQILLTHQSAAIHWLIV